MIDKKQIILSGMRPTGNLHIGHYFSVLKNWVRLQDEHICYYMIADLHALTTIEDTKNIKKDSLQMIALWLSAGLDEKKSTIFVQSHIPEHSELTIILSMLSPISMLELNPTYKEMREEHPKFNTLGLLAYPVLQASDILLYKASRVPIGKDQEPHLELARELTKRFNFHFKKIFPEPHALFEKVPKIMSLQDPLKKMSKSHKADSYISLLDSPEMVRGKIKKAVTDSGSEIKYLPKEKPALSNLITLYSLTSGASTKEIERKFAGKGYGAFKESLSDEINNTLKPIQQKFTKLMKNPDKIKSIFKSGAKKARKEASKNMQQIKDAVGI